MLLPHLLAELHRRGVRLSITVEGRLRVEAPVGVLTDDLRAAMRGHRDDLVFVYDFRYLSTNGHDPRATPDAPVPATAEERVEVLALAAGAGWPRVTVSGAAVGPGEAAWRAWATGADGITLAIAAGKLERGEAA